MRALALPRLSLSPTSTPFPPTPAPPWATSFTSSPSGTSGGTEAAGRRARLVPLPGLPRVQAICHGAPGPLERQVRAGRPPANRLEDRRPCTHTPPARLLLAPPLADTSDPAVLLKARRGRGETAAREARQRRTRGHGQAESPPQRGLQRVRLQNEKTQARGCVARVCLRSGSHTGPLQGPPH